MASTEQPADRDLIARTLAGDREAFTVLVKRYGRAVYARISRQVRYPEDAEDLVQEAFVKAYAQLAQLKDKDRFAAWLRAIADNEARMWHRRRYVQLRIEEMFEAEGTDASDDGGEMQRLQATVREALRSLTEAHRQVIVHHYFEGYTYLETAEMLGLDVGRVRSRLQKARRRLREEIISMNGQRISQTFELGREELHVLRQAKAFASRDESRRILQGICLDAGGRMVVTNGHVLLAWTSERLKGIATQVILWPWFEMEIPEGDRGTLSLSAEEAVLRMPGEKDRIAGIIPGPYVNYEAVIPRPGPIRATATTEALMKAVDLITDHLGPRHPTDPEGMYQYVPAMEIRLSGREQSLSLVTTREMGYSGPPDAEGKRQNCSPEEVLRLTSDTPVWTFATSIRAQVEIGGSETFRIGVNHTYLRELVHTLTPDSDEEMELRFTDPLKAILFLPVRRTDRKGLVMPLRMRRDQG